MKKEMVQPYFSNLFTILSAEKDTRLFDRKSVLNSIRETGLDKPKVTEIYNAWAGGDRGLVHAASPDDNTAMVWWLCSGLLSDDAMHDRALARLVKFSEEAGVPGRTVTQIFRGKERFRGEPSLKKRYMLISKAVNEGGLRDVRNGNLSDDGSSFYVANQVCAEGLDEIQRLLLAYHMGIHAALDGPPGVGKTRSIIEVARILDRNLHTKTCSSRTTESHIISHPVLAVENGVSVTSHINGPLALAMEEPGIFYGDEFNLLKEDVQKRLNSAFDERRCIDRNDGIQVMARSGFWGVISYNPTQNLVSRDLEDSVADRFIHIHYGRWTADFKAYVATRSSAGNDDRNTENEFGIKLGWRGVTNGNRFFTGRVEEGTVKWYDFFTWKPVPAEPEYIYRVHDRESFYQNLDPAKNEYKTLEGLAMSPVNFSRMISRFTEMLQSLATTGESPMLGKLGMNNIVKDEDLELMALHESSARIEIAAMRHYNELVSRGFNRFLAQSYATRLVIDQVCYGQYRDKKLRNTTVYEIVSRMAQMLRLLIGTKAFNTGFDVENILSKG